jgi:hypothetical protein
LYRYSTAADEGKNENKNTAGSDDDDGGGGGDGGWHPAVVETLIWVGSVQLLTFSRDPIPFTLKGAWRAVTQPFEPTKYKSEVKSLPISKGICLLALQF